MSQSGSLSAGGGGGGSVNSVNGTAGRITSTGGANPVINIDPAYVGQTSLTTLGTITTGVWDGTTVGPTFGGTGQSSYATGDTLYASAPNVLSKLLIGTVGQVLTIAGGVPTWATPAAGGVTSVSGTTNKITSSGGSTPAIDISAAYVGQTSITTLGTIATGTWQGTSVDLAHGGTNANLTASNGGIFYSSSTAGAILAGTATANKVLMSGSSTAPVWSTPTYPNASATSGKIIISDGTNFISSTATHPNTAATGDTIYGSATNVYSNLPVSGIYGSNIVALDTGTIGYNKAVAGPDIMILEDDFVYEVLAAPWSNQGNSGAININASTSLNPGVIQINTGTGTGTEQAITRGCINNTGQAVLGGGYHQYIMYIQIPVLSSGGDTFVFTCGLGNSFGGFQSGEPGTDGVFFQYNSASSVNWIGGTRASSTTTTVATGVAVGTSYVQLRFDVNAAASSVTFYINGNSVGTSSTNIPTSAQIGPGFKIRKTAGTTARNANIDYWRWYHNLTTSRF